ncbi:MAG TPA: hypothetical protein VHK45_11585 [Geminicoccaceae bacterium]|jgi:hypothetical protein|nr:hypothetical protein [Geminicoccaceae bacterium]
MKTRLTILLAASLGAGAAASAEATAAEEPKLILALTIDGLRGDIPFRCAERFGPGGFRYLMEQGVVYDNAHYLPGHQAALGLGRRGAVRGSARRPAQRPGVQPVNGEQPIM